MFSKKIKIVLLTIIALSACSVPVVDQVGLSSAHIPHLRRSFSLRQGRFSAMTCLAKDKAGHIYAAGFSDENCVLLKLDSDLKTLIKMIRFGSKAGGSYFSQDTVKDIAIDGKGNIFVVGFTHHKDFPTTQGCYDPVLLSDNGTENDEGFISKFSPDLKLLAATFIGGDSRDRIYGIAIDKENYVYVTGYSEGANPSYRKNFILPAKGYDPNPPLENQSKAFVAKLSNDLRTMASATFLGGNTPGDESNDCAYDIAIESDGHVWITGQTKSVGFPVTPDSYGRNLAGESDAFVAKFDGALEQLLAAAYVGGSKNDCANAIVLDGDGSVFVGGWSESSDMLVFLKGYDTKHSQNGADAFIVKMDTYLRDVQSATFLGGDQPAKRKGQKENDPGNDKLSCMILSDDGKTLFAAGRTESQDFSTTPPSLKKQCGNMVLNVMLDRSKALENRSGPDYGDGFIARFDTKLSTCISSSLFGGTNLDYIDDILLAGKTLYVAGETKSEDFPGMTINYTINATRGFVSRLDKNITRNFGIKEPMVLKPQFSDPQIKRIADTLSKNIFKNFCKQEIYSKLGSYAKKHISREMFTAKLDSALFLYGNPFKLDLKFHHYNYFQDDIDGYDAIELCYGLQNIPNPFYLDSNFNKGRIILTLLAKKKKWQLADIQYRGFSTETSKSRMQKKLD